MTIIEAFAAELEQEAKTTRKMLALIPNEKYGWQPHTKSMTIGRLANHIAELPGWIGMVLNTNELDFAKTPYSETTIKDTGELLAHYEKVLEQGRKELKVAKDDQLKKTWTLREGDQIFAQSSKQEMLRNTFSQVIHHRAQLGVFLRLLDIPIPGSYGPSADDQGL